MAISNIDSLKQPVIQPFLGKLPLRLNVIIVSPSSPKTQKYNCFQRAMMAAFIAGFFVIAYQSRHSSDWKKISPFTDVQFEAGKLFAEYQGTLYEVVSIEGLSSSRLMTMAKIHFGFRWKKRIREDLAEVLEASGLESTTTVRLELREIETGELMEVASAEMTQENRSMIYRGRM